MRLILYQLKTFSEIQLIKLEKENTQDMKPNIIYSNGALHKNTFLITRNDLNSF